MTSGPVRRKPAACPRVRGAGPFYMKSACRVAGDVSAQPKRAKEFVELGCRRIHNLLQLNVLLLGKIAPSLNIKHLNRKPDRLLGFGGLATARRSWACATGRGLAEKFRKKRLTPVLILRNFLLLETEDVPTFSSGSNRAHFVLFG